MGQSAYLEENFVIDLKSSTEMASKRSCFHRSLRWNPFPIDSVEDELTRDLGSDESLHLGNTPPALSHNLTPGPDLVPALIPVPVPALTPAPVAIDELFKKFMKAYLETNQEPREPPAECKQTLKAKVLEIYYGKSYMDYYHFCQ